jgi:hypothetical protein
MLFKDGKRIIIYIKVVAMKKDTAFYLKHLLGADSQDIIIKPVPDESHQVFFSNGSPVIGRDGKVFELYGEIDYLKYLSLRPHFSESIAFLYEGLRMIGEVNLSFKLPEGVYVTVERLLDQTVFHLVSEIEDRELFDYVVGDIIKQYDYVYIGTIQDSIENVLMKRLHDKMLHISFAESVTGGMLDPA